MVCLPAFLKKEKNAPPVFKPCLLVTLEKTNKAFWGFKFQNPDRGLRKPQADIHIYRTKSGMVGGCKNWWRCQNKILTN